MRPSHLNEFVGYAVSACEEATEQGAEAIFMADDDAPGLACLSVLPGQDPDTAMLDQLFAGHHDYAGMATMVNWSPNAETPTGPSWCLVAVKRNATALFAVGRIEERTWYELSPEDVPWFAASTAGHLRKVLDGQPFGEIKRTSEGDPRLFGTPGRGDPVPPIDAKGNI